MWARDRLSPSRETLFFEFDSVLSPRKSYIPPPNLVSLGNALNIWN